MSAMSCTVPGELLYSVTVPSAAAGVTTRLATVRPGLRLRLDAFGRGPSPHTVTNPVDVGDVAVRFSTTADTPAGSTQAFPSTPRCSGWLPATGPGAPSPRRVSRRRSGGTGPRP